jgi:hypothetical protein
MRGSRDTSATSKYCRIWPAPVARAHHRSQRLAPDPVAAALVADHVAPAAGARRFPAGVPAVDDRAGAGDDHDARRVAGPRDQRDERVVDDDRAGLVADAPHDGVHDAHLDLELAGDMQVRAGTAPLGDDAPVRVGEKTDGLRATRVDAEHVAR